MYVYLLGLALILPAVAPGVILIVGITFFTK